VRVEVILPQADVKWGNPLASPDRASWNRAVAPDRKTVGAQERFAVFFRFGSHVRFLIELCSGGRRL
jgi:hypothetical protein